MKYLNSALDSFNSISHNMGYDTVPKHNKQSSLSASGVKDISQKFNLGEDLSMNLTNEDNHYNQQQQQQPSNINDRLFSD